MIPNATRLIRFTRLLTASVGPFDTRARCHAVIWCFQRAMVRPSELHLGWARVVLEIVAELGDVLVGDGRVGDLVDRAGDLLGMPCHLDLTAGITGTQQPDQSGVAGLVETFMGLGQQPPGPIQRIVLAAPTPQRLVLDPATALIDLRVRQLHEVERVGDLGGVGQHGVEHSAIRTGQIQRGAT